jgi:predicted HTH transcriptional regulator
MSHGGSNIVDNVAVNVAANVTSPVTSLSPVQLNEKQKKILELIRKNSRISVKEMSLVLSQVERTIKRHLVDLQKKGILIREGNTQAQVTGR